MEWTPRYGSSRGDESLPREGNGYLPGMAGRGARPTSRRRRGSDSRGNGQRLEMGRERQGGRRERGRGWFRRDCQHHVGGTGVRGSTFAAYFWFYCVHTCGGGGSLLMCARTPGLPLTIFVSDGSPQLLRASCGRHFKSLTCTPSTQQECAESEEVLTDMARMRHSSFYQ